MVRLWAVSQYATVIFGTYTKFWQVLVFMVHGDCCYLESYYFKALKQRMKIEGKREK